MEVHYGIDRLPKFNNAVITIGSFDGVHCGHQKILERILELAGQINGESVVITFDPHPRHILQPDDHSLKLINTTDEKIRLLAENGIHHVVIVPFTRAFAQQSPDEYIENFLCALFHPKIIVIGYDHRFGTNRKGDINYLKQFEKSKGFQIFEIEKEMVDQMEVSSTKIRTAIEEGDIEKANKLLGYPYLITGTVVRGDQIGRELGFPTANIRPFHPAKLIPMAGIYACEIRVAATNYQGMLYIGTRPTLEKDNRLVIEAHIFDFNEEIYDQEIAVSILLPIRGDMHLTSMEALSRQIESDKQATLNYFKKKASCSTQQ